MPTPITGPHAQTRCRTGLPHARPCGAHPSGDSFFCACGCSGDETWCVADGSPIEPDATAAGHGWTAELDWNDEDAWFNLAHTSGVQVRFEGPDLLASNAEACFAACVADAAALAHLRRLAEQAHHADPDERAEMVYEIMSTLGAKDRSRGVDEPAAATLTPLGDHRLDLGRRYLEAATRPIELTEEDEETLRAMLARSGGDPGDPPTT